MYNVSSRKKQTSIGTEQILKVKTRDNLPGMKRFETYVLKGHIPYSGKLT